jgi:hypothetical protein
VKHNKERNSEMSKRSKRGAKAYTAPVAKAAAEEEKVKERVKEDKQKIHVPRRKNIILGSEVSILRIPNTSTSDRTVFANIPVHEEDKAFEN